VIERSCNTEHDFWFQVAIGPWRHIYGMMGNSSCPQDGDSNVSSMQHETSDCQGNLSYKTQYPICTPFHRPFRDGVIQPNCWRMQVSDWVIYSERRSLRHFYELNYFLRMPSVDLCLFCTDCERVIMCKQKSRFLPQLNSYSYGLLNLQVNNIYYRKESIKPLSSKAVSSELHGKPHI
jgi:hypothetical protein